MINIVLCKIILQVYLLWTVSVLCFKLERNLSYTVYVIVLGARNSEKPRKAGIFMEFCH